MYVDVLAGAFDAWDTDLSGEALLDYVVTCRSVLLATGAGRGHSAQDLLAAEVAYDRALIRLCDALGIAARIDSFADPRRERSRLESQLSAAGINLPSLSRARATRTEPEIRGSSSK